MVNLEEKINFLKDKKNIPIIVNILSKLYNNGNNVRYNGIYGDYISYTTHNSYVPIKLKINDLHLDDILPRLKPWVSLFTHDLHHRS